MLNTSLTNYASFAFLYLRALNIPNPNSALSSNKERAQEVPRPFSSTTQGDVVQVPPQTLEQPEALAIIILFP